MRPNQPSSVEEWLEALIGDDPVEGSISALQVAAATLTAVPSYDDSVRAARILLDESGALVSAAQGGLYRRAPLPVEVDANYVHPDVAAAEGAPEALDLLGVREVDAVQLLQARARDVATNWARNEWDLFWELVRKLVAHKKLRDEVARLAAGYRDPVED